MLENLWSIISTEKDCLLLTANKRLALFLHKHYQQWQQHRAHFWQTPFFMPLSAWISQTYETAFYQGLTGRQPLSTLQNEHIWHDIIQHQCNVNDLISPKQATTLIINAWNLLQQWRLSSEHCLFQPTQEQQFFQQCAKNYIQHCHEKQFIDQYQQVNEVIHLILAKKITLPRKIFLLGFTELTPLEQHLVETIQRASCSCTLHTIENQHQLTATHRFSTINDEMLAMANWIEKQNVTDPNSSILCIVPNLHEIRQPIDDCFQQCHFKYNISGGDPLASFDLIKTIFVVLHLLNNQISLAEYSFLIHSPYLLAATAEIPQRALSENKLRELGFSHITLQQLINLFEKFHGQAFYCPVFLTLLQNINDFKHRLPCKASHSHWSSLITQLLSLIGWPGSSALSSFLYQLSNKWQALMYQFTTLNLLENEISIEKVQYKLQCLSQSVLFQPESDEVNIHVLGLLEAAGMPADNAWVMNLTAQQWPSVAKPNPYLPYNLQRSYQLSHATAERELHYAKSMMTLWKKSIKQLNYSYSCYDGDNVILPSPLLPEHKQTIISPVNKQVLKKKTVSLETLEDNYGLTLTEKYTASTSIIKEQARCPFRAYALYRLKAQPLNTPSIGLTFGEKGSIAHAALESFWQEIKNSHRLQALTEKRIEQKMSQILTQLLQKILAMHIKPVNNIIFNIEKERLQTLLSTWLKHEKSNRNTFSIFALEHEQKIQLDNITLSMRIDRIDEIKQGQLFIIDYKFPATNISKNVNGWFEQRPSEPQLPLYALASEDKSIGIAYALIHPEVNKMIGLIANDESIANITQGKSHLQRSDDWQKQLSEWRHTLNNIAKQFANGYATADPKTLSECASCQLHGLCRINEHHHE